MVESEPISKVTGVRYQVDGVTYKRLDEMPPGARAKADRVLSDRDKNGVPDVMEDFVIPQINDAVRPEAQPPGGDGAGYANAGSAAAELGASPIGASPIGASPIGASPIGTAAPTDVSGGAVSGRTRTLQALGLCAAGIAVVVAIILIVT